MKELKAFCLALISLSFIPSALGYTFTQNITTQGMNGAVSCENKICSLAGASMFQKGGNAADAVRETK
jgi:gamma-glutamyltranspeptidase